MGRGARSFGRTALIVGLMAGSFGVGMGVAPLKVVAQTRNFSTFLQVYDLVRGEFLDPHLSDTKLEYGAIRGMLATLHDPYTRFMDPKAFKGMQDERHGEFSGIGIEIGMRGNDLTVIAPLPDTPASRAGLRAGDDILAVDGKPTRDMAIEEAVTRIRGRKGTKVDLLIGRNGVTKPFSVSITRGEIVTKDVTTKALPDDIGYIRLSSFMNENADQEIHKALLAMHNKKALILDLRGNPGGLLPNAVNIGMMFINHGPIVQIVDREGDRELLPDSSPGDRAKLVWPKSKPLVVLVDGGSASASEILSGALQDTHVGVLIGTRTFGKGLVQTVHSLDGGAGVAITTDKYLTAGGHDINKVGIVPNIIVQPMPFDALPKASQHMDGIPLDQRPGYKDTQLQMGIKYLEGRLGDGPKIAIPPRIQALDASKKTPLNLSLSLPNTINFDVAMHFKKGHTELADLLRADPLDSTLGDLGNKLRDASPDQVDAIIHRRDFAIEIDSAASKADGARVARARAMHVADYVRGFFLSLGESLDPRKIVVKTHVKNGADGQAELRIHLPYGEVLNSSDN